jgi:hypothetical protein
LPGLYVPATCKQNYYRGIIQDSRRLSSKTHLLYESFSVRAFAPKAVSLALFAGLQVVRVTFHFFNDVFRLNFTLEPTERVL